jgi:hypothetical protein
MPMAFGVAAGSSVLEGDSVLTAPAPSGHEGEYTESGDYGGDYGHPYRGIPRHAETIKPQVREDYAQVAAGQKTAPRAMVKRRFDDSIP